MVADAQRIASWFSPQRSAATKDVRFFAEGNGSPKEQQKELQTEVELHDEFELADRIEKGLSREIVTDVMSPVTSDGQKLERCHVVKSDDSLHHRLFSDSWDFLMYARSSPEASKVEFFMYDPDESKEHPFDSSRPAFTMTHSKDQREWRLVQERCDRCHFSPKHQSCASIGKQQVAFSRLLRRTLDTGTAARCMEVVVPALDADGEPVVWCSVLGRGDLASCPSGGSCEAQRLISKCPTWNKEVESLVLEFKGRTILASAKNFQLALPETPDDVVCQYGKIGPTTFSLDFKRPLSVIQAFALSTSTMFWS